MENLFGQDNWLYERTDDNKARFVLGEKGDNPLICVGVNPSTATPEKLDPTLRLVKGWANRLGYDGWIMLNLYPQRATNPNDLHVEYYNADIYFENLKQIESVLLGNMGGTVWAAWGTLIGKRAYLPDALIYLNELFKGFGCKVISIGKLSNAGHPHHPLYLPANSDVAPFDIDAYLKKLNNS